MPNKPRIALDAAGGDVGPKVNVPAAVAAAKAGIPMILVGDEALLKPELDSLGAKGLDIEIVHASQVVGMDEKPSEALRRKKDSSIQVACGLVKSGRASGIVSAGNSGATVGCGIFTLGRINGVERPALASLMPTETKPTMLIDVGANVDSKPFHLVQFGIMADVFVRDVMGMARPTVGLLSIGEEEGKGNAVVKEAYGLFKRTPLNFIGNVEGRDIFTGEVNIVVCDGFVGNVALKLAEGLGKSFGKVLKGELKRGLISKIGTVLSRRALVRFSRVLDYAEYGGAPLLGLKSIAVVCHGASNVKAMTNAIKMAATFAEKKVHEHLARELEAHSEISRFGRQAKA